MKEPKIEEGTLLIVDDEPEVARVLERSLRKNSFQGSIILAHDSDKALSIVKTKKPEVAIIDLSLDLNEGASSGLNLIDKIKDLDESIRILVLTSHSQKEYGLEALKKGALSFLNKPGDPNLLIALINDGFRSSKLLRSHKNLTNSLHLNGDIFGLKTRSPSMQEVIESLSFAVQNNQPVLITGETGTGKGVLARSIHKYSNRNKKNFVRYQSSFTSNDLVASELFGHKKGSFTGAQEDRIGLIKEADEGTLFIDEIDSIPKETQVTLLEVLQEKNFRKVGSNKLEKSDFRLISALNKNPKELIKKDIIRQDFFHRIAHITIDLPALRNRAEDIEILADDFFQFILARERLPLRGIESKALKKLQNYNWPGNIRELQSTIEKACHLSTFRGHDKILESDIHLDTDKTNSNNNEESISFRNKIKAYEEELATKALIETEGNQTKAATLLGVDRIVLRRILERIKDK